MAIIQPPPHPTGGDLPVLDAELVPSDAPQPRRIIDATATVRRQSVAVITTVRSHEPTVRTVAAGVVVLQGFESWGKRGPGTARPWAPTGVRSAPLRQQATARPSRSGSTARSVPPTSGTSG